MRFEVQERVTVAPLSAHPESSPPGMHGHPGDPVALVERDPLAVKRPLELVTFLGDGVPEANS